MNILHLLSWFPTPDDPTLGNFCVRMIDALPEDCHSVILSVCDGKDITKSYEVKEIKGAHHTLTTSCSGNVLFNESSIFAKSSSV